MVSTPPTRPKEAGTGRQALRRIVNRSDRLIQELQKASFDPEVNKTLPRQYTITRVTQMVGRSDSAIRKAEAAGDLPQPKLSPTGRRVGYRLVDVNRIRDHFGTNPYRADGEDPVWLAFQNFKGGVGKSTLCAHFSQYLAERGYRVLVVDCDSQASTTTMFGYQPDLDLDEGDTLLPFLEGAQVDLAYAIRPTYWDRLDLLPSNLSLYNAEYLLAANAGGAGGGTINHLHAGLATVSDRYDVVIMDPPPALGMISLNVARAANALIVPCAPTMLDFHSTVSFFRMMEEVLETVERAVGAPVDYKFLKLLVSKENASKGAHEDLLHLMQEHYSRNVLRARVKDSAEIDNAGAEWRTVYELEKPTTSAQTYKRCLVSLGAVFREIEFLIRETWPSHASRLEGEGVAGW